MVKLNLLRSAISTFQITRTPEIKFQPLSSRLLISYRQYELDYYIPSLQLQLHYFTLHIFNS